MNAKTLIDLLSQLDPVAEVVLVMQPPYGPLPSSRTRRELDGCDCEHQLGCDVIADESDVVVAKVEAHSSWLVVRSSE